MLELSALRTTAEQFSRRYARDVVSGVSPSFIGAAMQTGGNKSLALRALLVAAMQEAQMHGVTSSIQT
jgi:hypothetical protein